MGAFRHMGRWSERPLEMTANAATGRETVAKSARSVKVDRRSLDWRAADVLREQILSGKLVPGQRITRLPWRRAGSQPRDLAGGAARPCARGADPQVAYTKWMLPEFSNSDAWELYTLRGTLEGMAARLAAQHRTEKCVLRLEAAFERLVAAVKSKRHAKGCRCGPRSS